MAGARSWREFARGWKKNRWRSGIGRFRTEVLGRGMPEGVATEHTECGIKGRAWIPGREWRGFRFETLEQDWFGANAVARSGKIRVCRWLREMAGAASVGWMLALKVGCWVRLSRRFMKIGKARGKGLACRFSRIVATCL